MIPLLAPILGELARNGLSILANAIMAKGKDVIEEKLGVDISTKIQTPEGLLELKKLEFSHQEFLITAAQKEAERELEFVKEGNRNTDSARQMNVKVQESANADHISKVAAYYLDFIIVLSTIGLAYIIFCMDGKIVNQELAYTAFGSLLTMCGTILNFHRGTSRGSQTKDTAIDALTKVNMRKTD